LRPTHFPYTTLFRSKDAGDYVQVETAAQRKPAGDEFLSADNQDSAPGDIKQHFGIFDGGDDNYDRFRIRDYEIREEAIIGSRQKDRKSTRLNSSHLV